MVDLEEWLNIFVLLVLIIRWLGVGFAAIDFRDMTTPYNVVVFKNGDLRNRT